MEKAIKKYGLFLIAGIILITAVVLSIDSQNEGWKVDDGTSEDVTIPDGSCQKVTNNHGKDIFVPTKTMDEWNDFKNNLPSRVNVGACAAPPPPPPACAKISTFKTYPGSHNCPGSGFGDVANCLAAPWPAGYPGCPGTKNCLCNNWVAGGNIWSTLDMCCC